MKEFPSPRESVLSLFKNMARMFDGEAFPHVDALYQFVFTDIENGFPVHIRFAKGSAEYGEGLNERPSVVITTTSDVWLDIAGRFRSPGWALLTRKVRVKGDMRLLRLLPRLLTRTIKLPRPQRAPGSKDRPFKALVFIGNPRKKNGLTGFFLSPFVEGMKKAGAEVEEVHLYDKKINHCLGCFACWTRTPGVCVHKDDQKELLEKMEGADLIVYATGYGSMNGWAARLISQDVADKVGRCWGLGSGTTKDPGPYEGELRNMWKPTQQQNLWFHGGNLHQSRHYSLYLALQLKARFEGLDTSVYKLAPSYHQG